MPDQWKTLKEWPELVLDRLADAGVARITLNRPEKRNSWNRALCHAFLESLDIIRADKELKIVITRGAGTVYSSGLDLTFLREVSNGPMLDWDRPNLTIQIAEDIRVVQGGLRPDDVPHALPLETRSTVLRRRRMAVLWGTTRPACMSSSPRLIPSTIASSRSTKLAIASPAR